MKKVMLLILIINIFLGSTIFVFANEINNTEKSLLNLQAPYLNENDVIIISEEDAKASKNEISLLYREAEYETVLDTNYRTVHVTPSGQPTKGFKLSSGGLVNVSTDGGFPLQSDVSVDWGVVSLDVESGYTTMGGFANVGIQLGDRTNYWIIKMGKGYKIEHIRRDYYKYGVYQYSYYHNRATLNTIDYYNVRA